MGTVGVCAVAGTAVALVGAITALVVYANKSGATGEIATQQALTAATLAEQQAASARASTALANAPVTDSGLTALLAQGEA